MKSGLKNYANIKIDNGNAVEKEELLSYFGKLKSNPELSKIVSIRFCISYLIKNLDGAPTDRSNQRLKISRENTSTKL